MAAPTDDVGYSVSIGRRACKMSVRGNPTREKMNLYIKAAVCVPGSELAWNWTRCWVKSERKKIALAQTVRFHELEFSGGCKNWNQLLI